VDFVTAGAEAGDGFSAGGLAAGWLSLLDCCCRSDFAESSLFFADSDGWTALLAGLSPGVAERGLSAFALGVFCVTSFFFSADLTGCSCAGVASPDEDRSACFALPLSVLLTLALD